MAVSGALARELGAAVGDEVLLSFPRPSEVPRDTVLASQDAADALDTLRLTVAEVLPDAGIGRFSLAPHQAPPLNAFVELAALQRAVGVRDRANALLAGGGRVGEAEGEEEATALDGGLRKALTLDDLGLALRPGPGWVTVESRELVLRPAVAKAIEAAATAAGAPAVAPILTYLANSLAVGGREIPYSTVTALALPVAPAFGALIAAGGGSVPASGGDGILLDAWAAEDLGAAAGDRLTLTYYVVGRDDRLETATAELRVAGVVEMAGLAADPTLTPELPGIADADRIAAWKPPFPIDLGRIRPRDEAYWDRYRATPKAFVSLATGQRLWGSRFGDLTGVRVALPAGADPAEFERSLTDRLLAGLPLPALGLAFQPVKARGLAAAAGATDFSGLFVGFSLFLIVAAALLVALLFSLAVEQRAGEIGLRLAVGYPLKRVRRRLLAEGAVIAAAGALAGTGLAVAYAGLVLRALGSWWRPLVATPFLGLAVEPVSLALGFALSMLLVLGAILATLRRLRRVPAVALLRGETVVPETAAGPRGGKVAQSAAVLPADDTAGEEFPPGRRAVGSGRPAARMPGRWATRIAWGGLAVAVALLGAALFAGGESSAGLFFGVGAALLTAGFAAFARWCRRSGGGLARLAGGGSFPLLAGMAARNSARNPGRSLLSVVLVGCAVFVLVSVAANRREAGGAPLDRASGAGGFALVAQSDVPIRQPLDRPEGLAELGLSPEAIAELAGARVVPLRLRPGEDASCLNLYQPTRPRVLGVPAEFIERGGFRFKEVADAPTRSRCFLFRL